MAGNNLVSSFRRVNAIPGGAAHDTVIQALRDHDKGLLDLQTAIPLLKSQIDALKAGAKSTTTTVISGGGGGGSSFPNGIGTLSNQTGITAYTMQTTDNGALVLFSDASPVAVTLNTAVNPPYFFYAVNWGAGLVTFTPPTPTTISYINNLGAASMPLATGYLAMIVFDGANFWAATLPTVPVSIAKVAHEWLDSYSISTGLFTQSQPAFTDISGVASPSQLPTPTATTIGGVEAAGPTAHEWVNEIDTSGVPHLSQPAFSDLSGTINASQVPGGASASLGGSAMTAGQTITIAVTVTGATTSMCAVCSPQTYPGDGFVWDAYVSAASTVTVRLTAVLAGTPTASVYSARVIP